MVNLQTDGANNVKVKLTTRLATGAGLLLSAHSIARWRGRRGEVVTRGGVKQVWSSRGEGGCHPGPLREKDQHGRGRAFSEPSQPSETPYFIDLLAVRRLLHR